MNIKKIEINMTVSKANAREATIAFFKMFHSNLPSNYRVNDSNTDVVKAVANVVHAVSGCKECKGDDVTVSIKTTIHDSKRDSALTGIKFGGISRYAEHVVRNVYKENSNIVFIEEF